MKANLPKNEAQRLRVLRQYNILDTLPEQAFDDLTTLASYICGTPIALLSFIEEDRQWFKSKIGFEQNETSRETSFCSHALLQPEELLVVPDTLQDSRFFDHPAVTGATPIRFYAGAPLVAPTGEALGTLCVVDTTPHELLPAQQEALRALARQTMAQLELRRQARELAGEMAVKVQTEAALRESEGRFQSFMDHSPLIAFLKDEQGRYVYVNQPFLRRFNFKAEEVIGCDDAALWPHAAPKVREWDMLALAEDQIVTNVESWLNPDGDYDYWRVYKFPLRQGGGKRRLIAGLSLDITESQRSQVQLEEYHHKLEEALRLKDEFVSVVSHELRTPLTSIYGSLGLVMGGVTGELSDRTRQVVEIAQRNSTRLLALINDLLDLQKIENGQLQFHLEPLDLVAHVRQSLESNAAYAAQLNVAFVLTQTPDELPLQSDASRLNQVLANLLSNAAKFSPENATVKVTIRKSGPSARVEVHNQGEGIPVEFQHRIFQKFAQADTATTRPRGGTGLGLSICKAIIEQLGGTIGFATSPKKGTTFFFELPLS